MLNCVSLQLSHVPHYVHLLVILPNKVLKQGGTEVGTVYPEILVVKKIGDFTPIGLFKILVEF